MLQVSVDAVEVVGPEGAAGGGEVSGVLDSFPDNPARALPSQVTLRNFDGNYAMLPIVSNRYVSFAHLQAGSVRVHLHLRVRRSDVLALVGNSGQAYRPALALSDHPGELTALLGVRAVRVGQVRVPRLRPNLRARPTSRDAAPCRNAAGLC